MNKKTELMELAEAMRYDDSHIGDLCSDIFRDLKFPTLGTEEQQISYLMFVCREYDVKVALIDFLEILLDNADEYKEQIFDEDEYDEYDD